MHYNSAILVSLVGAFVVAFAQTTPGPSAVTWAPIPSSSIGEDTGPDGWRIDDFGDGAYMASDNQYQAMFLVSTAGVIVLDAPPTMGRSLLWAIGNTTDVPITHLVYSHSHSDHIGGAYMLTNSTNKGCKIKIVAHQFTHDLLKMEPDPTRPLPTVVFDTDYTLQVGNQTVELSYKGDNHLPGNIFMYAPAQKVLMLVDIVYPGWAPFANLGQAAHVPGYIEAYDHVLTYDFKHLVAGHVTRSGTRDDVRVGQRYVQELKANCMRAIELSALPANATNPINAYAIMGPAMAANPDNPWAWFKVYLDTLATYCSDKTNENWLGVIGGVDTFGFENAWTMVEALRIDYGILGPFGVPR